MDQPYSMVAGGFGITSTKKVRVPARALQIDLPRVGARFGQSDRDHTGVDPLVLDTIPGHIQVKGIGMSTTIVGALAELKRI